MDLSTRRRPIIHLELNDFKCTCCNSKYLDNEISNRESVKVTHVSQASDCSTDSQKPTSVASCSCFKSYKSSLSGYSPDMSGCSCGLFHASKLFRLLSCFGLKCLCLKRKKRKFQ